MSDKRTSEKRRDFLKGVLVGGGAAAVALASGQGLATPPEKGPAAAPKEGGKQGYRVTAHIAEYYKRAQF